MKFHEITKKFFYMKILKIYEILNINFYISGYIFYPNQ
jgi:hypothetical protein